MNLNEYQRSRSFIDLGPRSLLFTFSNFFSLETAWPIESKFHVEPPWDGGMKFCSNGPGHIAAMVKILKNLLLWNQTADGLDSNCWYAALGTRVLPSLFKC